MLAEIGAFLFPTRRFRLLVTASAICAELSAGLALAQEFNPTVLAPASPPPTRGVRAARAPSRAGLDMPPNADKTFVVIRHIALDAAFPEMEAENAAFIAKLQGQRVSVAQLYIAARELQLAYSKVYALAQISIPAQNLKSGNIRVAVTDGYIQSLDLSKVPEDVRELVRQRVEPLVGKRHLELAEYQRRTILIGYLPGITGQATTTPGGAADENILVVEVKENRLMTSSVIDNRLPREFGAWSFSNAAAINNPLGFGEQIALGSSTTPDFDRYFSGTAKAQAYSADVSAPIGADGLMVGVGYLEARSRATPQAFSFEQDQLDAGERASNRFDRSYAKIAYPLFLMAERSLKAQAVYEYVDSRTRVDPFALGFVAPKGFIYDVSHDRFSVIRFSGEGMSEIPWWELGARATGLLIYSHGLGGRTAWDAPIFGNPLTRPGSGPNFNKLAFKARLDMGLPENFRFSFVARGQTSFGQPLMISENLSLDSNDAVSGFAAGTLNVDRGLTLRSELSRPFIVESLGVGGAVAPYLFGAWGRGVHEWPGFPFEPKRLRVETFGAGIRADTSITGSPFGESASIEFGKDFSNIPFRENGYRLNFAFNVRYAGNPFDPDVSPVADVPTKGPVKGPKPEPLPAMVWEGFYAGLNAGYAWDPLSETVTAGSLVQNGLDNFLAPGFDPPHGVASAASASGASRTNAGNFIGGGQIGYNSQFNKFVLGLEADLQGSNTRNRHDFLRGAASLDFFGAPDIAMTNVEHEKNVDWLGTVRGRAGYLFTPAFLGYATGGLAYGGVRADTFVSQNWGGAALGPLFQSAGAIGHYSAVRLGWTIGGGVEWMFAPNTSLKAEYLYYDLGGATYASSPLTTFDTLSGFSNTVIPFTRVKFRGDLARVGLNYHFGQSEGKAAALPPTPITTGFYAGLNAGYSWDASPGVTTTGVPARSDLDDFLLTSFNAASAISATGVSRAKADGALGGAQFGYNYQADKFLVGVETDIQGAAATGRGGFAAAAEATSLGLVPAGTVATSVANEKTVDWLGTLRGRAGYLVTPELLGYATGGVAFGGVTAHTLAAQTATSALPLQTSNAIGHLNGALFGWTAGGGVEWMFAPNTSLKAEYLFYDLGHLSYASTPFFINSALAPAANAVAPVSHTRFNGHLARLGINYHFDLFQPDLIVVKQ